MKGKSFAILLCGIALVAGTAASGGLIFSSYISKEASAASQYSWTADKDDHTNFGSTSGTATLGDIAWNYTQGSASYTGWLDNCIQLGKKDSSSKAFTLSATLPESYGSAISSISVVTASKDASSKLTIKIGDEVVVNNVTTGKWTTLATITTGAINPVKTGTIQLSWTASTAALYLKSITIVGADISTDFVTQLDVDPTSKSYHTSSVLQAADFDVTVTKNGAAGTSGDYTAKIGTGVGAGFTGTDIVWGTTKPTLTDETIQFRAKYPQSELDLTYLTADVSIDVSPVILSSLAISGTLVKSDYYEYESFESAGITVTATFNDGSSADVTSQCTYTPSVLSAGTTSIDVSYTVGGVTKNTTIGDISVTARSVAAISVLTNPTKMVYTIGQNFDPTGMKIRATYDVGPDNDDYLAYIYSPTSAFLAAGNETITITSSDNSSILTTFDVEVVEMAEGTYDITSHATIYTSPMNPDLLTIDKSDDNLPAISFSEITNNVRLFGSPITESIMIGNSPSSGGSFKITLDPSLFVTQISFLGNDKDSGASANATLTVNQVSVKFSEITNESVSFKPYANSFTIASSARVWVEKIVITAKLANNAALDFGTYLLEKTNAECASLAVKSSTWSQIAAAYNGADSSIKSIIDAAEPILSGNDLEQAMARYDYIVGKYSYSDFLEHGVASINRNVFVNTPSNTTFLFLSFATIIVSGTCLYFLLKKKKAN